MPDVPKIILLHSCWRKDAKWVEGERPGSVAIFPNDALRPLAAECADAAAERHLPPQGKKSILMSCADGIYLRRVSNEDSMSHTIKPLARIREHSRAGVLLRERFFEENAPAVANLALRYAVTLAKGGKILFCGNGGSAADAQHLAAEFVNRFQIDRPPLPAIALTVDTSIITAAGNDFGFDFIFSKQVQALAAPGDVLTVISTSGNSMNLIKALEAAREQSVYCLGLLGKGGGKAASLCDAVLDVPGHNTALIQEVHITVGHLLCSLTDHYLFENAAALTPWLEGNEPLPL